MVMSHSSKTPVNTVGCIHTELCAVTCRIDRNSTIANTGTFGHTTPENQEQGHPSFQVGLLINALCAPHDTIL
jgi:hypothetical protein